MFFFGSKKFYINLVLKNKEYFFSIRKRINNYKSIFECYALFNLYIIFFYKN